MHFSCLKNPEADSDFETNLNASSQLNFLNEYGDSDVKESSKTEQELRIYCGDRALTNVER